MKNPITRFSLTSRIRTPRLFVSAAVLALLAAGCNNDTITYVNDSPPAVPTGVTTISGDQWVEVLWYPVIQEDIAGYGVYRSSEANGTYYRLATIENPDTDSYRDTAVTNGTTYYYAVDAFDSAGNESDLSYELAFDTPRPDSEAGGMAQGPIRLFARQVDATRAGIDFSSWDTPGEFVAASTDGDIDVLFHRVDGLLYAVGTVRGNIPNDLQDLGWTDTMDDISWAPGDGWAVSPVGVELIVGHTYVVWTWDEHFAKFRVISLDDPQTPSNALLDWAYQTDPQNQELKANPVGIRKTRAVDGGIS